MTAFITPRQCQCALSACSQTQLVGCLSPSTHPPIHPIHPIHPINTPVCSRCWMLDALPQIVLRTVNSSRSAYACYVFKESFFQEFNAPNLPWTPDPASTQAGSSSSPSQQSSESAEPLRCKASSKVCDYGAQSIQHSMRARACARHLARHASVCTSSVCAKRLAMYPSVWHCKKSQQQQQHKVSQDSCMCGYSGAQLYTTCIQHTEANWSSIQHQVNLETARLP